MTERVHSLRPASPAARADCSTRVEYGHSTAGAGAGRRPIRSHHLGFEPRLRARRCSRHGGEAARARARDARRRGPRRRPARRHHRRGRTIRVRELQRRLVRPHLRARFVRHPSRERAPARQRRHPRCRAIPSYGGGSCVRAGARDRHRASRLSTSGHWQSPRHSRHRDLCREEDGDHRGRQHCDEQRSGRVPAALLARSGRQHHRERRAAAFRRMASRSAD